MLNATYLLNFFFLSLCDIIPSKILCTCYDRGSRVRGFVPSVLDREEGLIVSYPHYIIADRMFNRPGSYGLWGVSVIRVVSPVNVSTVSAHLNTNSCLKLVEDEQKKLMSV